jgi:hypothetical protein
MISQTTFYYKILEKTPTSSRQVGTSGQKSPDRSSGQVGGGGVI